jgi:hypothetical protein
MPTAEIDKELVAALNAAKSKAHNFAIIVKGAAVVHLLVSKLPIKDAETLKAKKEHAGTGVIRGTCAGHNGELVFRVAEDPGVEDLKLKTFIATATMLSLKPHFEVSTEESAGHEGEAEGSSEAKQTGSDGGAAAFAARLTTLKPKINEAAQSASPLAVHVKTLTGQMSADAKAGHYEAAIGKLDLIEKVLAKMESEAPSTPGSNAPPTSGGVEPWALSPKFDTLWKEAKSAWQTALDNIGKQLEKLRGSLAQAGDSDLKAIGEFGLNAITANHKVPLQTAIVNVDSTVGPAKIKAIDKAQDAVIAFREHIDRDERVDACDNNPFGVQVALRSELNRGLDKLGHALDEALV